MTNRKTVYIGPALKVMLDARKSTESISGRLNRLADECQHKQRESKAAAIRFLAKATTANEEFSAAHLHVLVTIGKGMLWSREFDDAAHILAEKIERELDRYSVTPE